MKILSAAIILVLCASTIDAEELAPIDNRSFAQVLAFGHELANSSDEASFRNLVRITSFPTILSECERLEQCPDHRLVFVLTTGDLYDEPAVFELPVAKGWEFMSWFAPDDPEAGGFVVKTAIPTANLRAIDRRPWWPTTYRVIVTASSAEFDIVGAGEICADREISIEPDMRMQEADFTLESYYKAVERLSSLDQEESTELSWIAEGNTKKFINGWLLKKAALESIEARGGTRNTEEVDVFCIFLANDAFYLD